VKHVLLIDNNPVFRLGLQHLIKDVHADTRISEAGSFAQARQILNSISDLVLILLDIRVSDCGGFVGLFQLRKEFQETPIILCSDSSDAETISRAVAFGADGYILKSSPCETVSKVLQAMLTGRSLFPVPIAADRNQANPIGSLSPAQLRVLKGLNKGLRNKEIAFELGLTEKTVKAYMSTLYRKLGVGNRAQALILLQQFNFESQLQDSKAA
jgi:DNA-binding NarL/FixJ family response regulator